MADSVKVEHEAVLKFALVNVDGTSMTTRSITVANPRSSAIVKSNVSNLYSHFGPSGTTMANFVQYASFKDEDEDYGVEPYNTAGLEAAIVDKTTTTLDWQNP